MLEQECRLRRRAAAKHEAGIGQPPKRRLHLGIALLRDGRQQFVRELTTNGGTDLRYLFGDAFGTRIDILTMSQYRGDWPVNRARQGEDVIPETGLAGPTLSATQRSLPVT